MSSKKLITYTATAFMAVAVGFMACKKDNSTGNGTITNPANEEGVSYAFDDANLEQRYHEVYTFADQAAALGTLAMKGGDVTLGSGCALVTSDTAKKTIVINFGNDDCLCKDGRKRRGIINITYTRKYADSASNHNIVFVDYYVNGNKVFGSTNRTNMGLNKSGQRYYKILCDAGMILAEGKGTIRRNVTRVMTQVQGQYTAIFTDDVFNLTGSGTFTNTNDKTYNVVIKSPLEIANSCNWIKAGTLDYSIYDNISRVFDYGDGGCDDRGKLTMNSKVTDEILK